MKRLSGLSWIFILLFVLILFLTSCSEVNESLNTENQPQTGSSETVQNTWTEPVPETYTIQAREQGEIRKLEYPSKDYAGEGEEITKTAYVYLPYGYSQTEEEQNYDVLYLLHGWMMGAEHFFYYSDLKNILDHMIESGEIAPLIVVSATFDAENKSQDLGRSLQEMNCFNRDLRNNLIPAVESRFHTYAQTVDDKGLQASRDHRAFGGFSLGSVATWKIFQESHDWVRFFLPMSGASWNPDIEQTSEAEYAQAVADNYCKFIDEENLEDEGYFIYAATGTEDPMASQMESQIKEMQKKDQFTTDHLLFCYKQGGMHDLDSAQEYIYNALPFFFKNNKPESTDELTENSTVNEVLSVPAFNSFGRLLFPLRDNLNPDMTIAEVTSEEVFPGCSNLSSGKSVEVLNFLKDRGEEGEQIFYPIYSKAERKEDSDKENAGLFYFPGITGEKFAILNAGGGMEYVAALHESFPQALKLSQMGYNSFALIYRPGHAYEDLVQAIVYINDHALKLGVDPSNYSLWGVESGARLAGTLGNSEYFYQLTGREDLPRPAAVIIQDSSYAHVSRTDAPAYACAGMEDESSVWRLMYQRAQALKQFNISSAFHAYKGVGNRFGLGDKTKVGNWINEAVKFWEQQVK